jgi:general secretion pathway protein I
MIALAIVALGMIAVHMQLGRYAQSAIRTEEKTLASWIATNKITELSVQKTWPELGKDEEDLDFAGRAWHYRVEVSKTPADNLRRVDVSVYLADRPDILIDKVSGFIEPPLPPGFGPVRWLTSGGQRDAPRGRSSGSGGRNGGQNGGQNGGSASGEEREGPASGQQRDAPPGLTR